MFSILSFSLSFSTLYLNCFSSCTNCPGAMALPWSPRSRYANARWHPCRRRSRSPFDRDRRDRPRSPFRRVSPLGPRGGISNTYRPRSRSPLRIDRRDDRRDDRYAPASTYRRPSPPRERESVVQSAITSRSNSRVSSPRPMSRGFENRSRHQSPLPHSPAGLSSANAIPVPVRTATPRSQTPLRSPPRAKSPPRGPAALRAPPTGPSATRNFTASNAAPAPPPRYPPTPTGSHSRVDVASPTAPPSGPRGYVAPPARGGGGFGTRGGRGQWPAQTSRFAPPPVSPATPHSTNNFPTGPRASISSASSPSLASKPFNPPTGPAAQGGQRLSVAQNHMAGMPPIIPGGKIDPQSTPLTTGVTKDLEAHHRRLKEEEERIREGMRQKEQELRIKLRQWDRLDREAESYQFKSELSEQSLQKIAGEGVGGIAF